MKRLERERENLKALSWRVVSGADSYQQMREPDSWWNGRGLGASRVEMTEPVGRLLDLIGA